MFSTIRDAKQREEGFTLIELLVVVIIIGILAAIAIPTFMSQRERGWQAEVTSDVRNAALEIEAMATAAGGSYPAVDDVTLADLNPGQNTTLSSYSVDGTSARFCVVGTHAQFDNNVVAYDSGAGGLLDFHEAGYTCETGEASAS